MEAAPVGAMHEIVYAVLAKRLKRLLTADSPLQALLAQNLVHTAINFRALNPGFFASPGGHTPTTPPNTGAQPGDYHSKIWGPTHDERIPHTDPAPTASVPYSIPQDPQNEQNKGLLIAKLFADLQHHIPLVLFNISDEDYIATGVGGDAVVRKAYRNGMALTTLGYMRGLTVEATIVAGDQTAASELKAIVESCFGLLRDQVDSGASVVGRSWALNLPTSLGLSQIQEVDAPWSMGDDKGAKIYTSVITLNNLVFECYATIGREVSLAVSFPVDDVPAISLDQDSDPTKPIQLKLGVPVRLRASGMPITAQVMVSQTKRVIEVQNPLVSGTGYFEVIPRRVGEADILLVDTGSSAPLGIGTAGASGRGVTSGALTTRHVVVTAV
jgi:hypothetical protein